MSESRPWFRSYQEGVPSEITWPDGPLDGLLRRSAEKYPSKTALVFFDRTLTYGEVDNIVDQLAAGLRDKGLAPGDRVSLFMPNCPQLVMAYQAVWRCGGVAVPSNPLYTAAEFAHQSSDAGSRFALVMSMMYERVKEARPNTSIEHVVVTSIKEYFNGPLKAMVTLLRERKGGHRVDISGDADTYEWNEVLVARTPQPVEVASGDLAMLMYMILAAGGFNVYPREVEDALFEHSAVVDAGVIGVPVGGQDQRVKAFVVLEKGSSVTEEELIEFCRDRLARYKLPRSIEFRDELPKTFVGKVLRRELMAEEQARQAE